MSFVLSMVKETTLLGRVAVLKSFILSKLIHLWMLLPNPPDNFVNELHKTVFQFVWNRKQDRICRKMAVRSIMKGGLGIPNIKTYQCIEVNLDSKIKDK